MRFEKGGNYIREENEENSKKKQLLFNPDGSINLPSAIEKDFSKGDRKQRENERKMISERIKKASDDDFLDIWEEDSEDKILHSQDSVEGFSLYNSGEKLVPLKFSNGKTQEDIVDETVSHIKNGKKVIFIRGMCGTGKSAIALNIGKLLGRASIVVPGKSLQKQYMDDYSKNKYVLKKDHRKLKIRVITGRENHKCLFESGKSANDSFLPCKIDIKESNYEKLKEYLKQNPKVKDDLELKDIRRVSVASVCPYWSPAVPEEIELPLKAEKRRYKGVGGNYVIYNRKPGCKYYAQSNSYIDNDVIVFNSMKYKIEMALGRKPKTEVDVIDECDEFLDSFSNSRRVNITRLSNALNNVFPEGEELRWIIQKMEEIALQIIKNTEFKEEVIALKDTKLYTLFRYFLENPNLLNEVDEENYAHSAYEAALMFEDFFDDSYVVFRKEERGVVAEVVTTNLSKKFEEFLDKTEALVFMSGTIHGENILKNVFGVSDFVVVDAETLNQGKVDVLEIGSEFDCRYDNFSQGRKTRGDYLKALNSVIEKAPRPTLVHVNAFDDLPSSEEKYSYDLDSLITKEKLREINDNSTIERFKKGHIPVLFTTKCSRGIDFPGEQCNSIVFTKYPNPNARGIFWKILSKTHSAYYWEFYKDKAKREFLQKIYRGVRSKSDNIVVMSPDLRVLDAVKGEFLDKRV